MYGNVYVTVNTETTTTKEQRQMQVFEYIVTNEPRDEKGEINTEQVTLLAGPTVKLARDEIAVKNAAIHDLGDDVNIDDVKVLVRPFDGY